MYHLGVCGGAQGGFILSLALPEDDKYYDDKADILELNGLSEAASFVLRANEEPSEQLLGFLRLLNLSGRLLPLSSQSNYYYDSWLLHHNNAKRHYWSFEDQNTTISAAGGQRTQQVHGQQDISEHALRSSCTVWLQAAVVWVDRMLTWVRMGRDRAGCVSVGAPVPQRGVGPHAGAGERSQRARGV